MAAQRERLKNMFARHVIDSLGIGKGASSDYLTMDALREEFNAIDVGEEGGDGMISKAVSVQKNCDFPLCVYCALFWFSTDRISSQIFNNLFNYIVKTYFARILRRASTKNYNILI